MTKSKKQRQHQVDVAHEKQNFIILGVVVAIILISILVMAS